MPTVKTLTLRQGQTPGDGSRQGRPLSDRRGSGVDRRAMSGVNSRAHGEAGSSTSLAGRPGPPYRPGVEGGGEVGEPALVVGAQPGRAVEQREQRAGERLLD